MDAVAALKVVLTLTAASTAAASARAFASAVQANSAIPSVICYQRDATGDMLLPLANADSAGAEWPEIAMGELDNPLVFSLLSGKPCFIERISRLIAVGSGFEALRTKLDDADALLCMPLLDIQGKSLGVLVLSGGAWRLQGWRDDAIWQSLMRIFQQLLAQAVAQQDAVESVRFERATQRSRENELALQRSGRLLAAEFVGSSQVARQTRADIVMLAESSLAVLITGETGTGKDHAAWLLHQVSARSGKPFVPVNCAAIPKDRIEVELFGEPAGAHAATGEKQGGLIGAAAGGTLFLNEIGDMPLDLQGALLRLIDEKKYSAQDAVTHPVADFRLICATHQPLKKLVQEGRFREDLYFRIRQLSLHLPPLRERIKDVALLISHVINQHNRERHTHIAGMARDAMTLLEHYDFPGNVRELRSLVLAASERTLSGQTIDAETVGKLMLMPASQTLVPRTTVDPETVSALMMKESLPQALEAFEQIMIDAHLRQAQGSRSRAAESLGIPKRTLARKCQKLNLEIGL